MAHAIELGTLVEIQPYKKVDEISPNCGLRLYVVGRYQDTDGTPLYRLSFMTPKNFDEWKAWQPHTPSVLGIPEHLLKVIQPNPNLRGLHDWLLASAQNLNDSIARTDPYVSSHVQQLQKWAEAVKEFE